MLALVLAVVMLSVVMFAFVLAMIAFAISPVLLVSKTAAQGACERERQR
jgi:hypothetical protein